MFFIIPQSINLGTWGDRKGSSSSASSSRGDGRGTPSLKERLRKYGDGYGNDLDELRSIPEQVRASYGSKAEQPSSSASSRYPKVIGAKPFKRPSLSQMTSAGSTGSTASSDDLSKSDIVTATKKSSSTKRPTAASIFAGRGAADSPDGDSAAHPPPPLPPSNGAPKPQFYFGEDVLNGHESNGADLSLVSRKQSAIDKVKTNEAVSHPKNIVINPGYKIKDYVDPTEKSGKPSFAFGEVPAEIASNSARAASTSSCWKRWRSASPCGCFGRRLALTSYPLWTTKARAIR